MQANKANFRPWTATTTGTVLRRVHQPIPVRRKLLDRHAAALAPPVLEDEYTRLDRNRDGVLSQGEWVAGADAFRRYDRNNDGRVTRDEYASPLDPNSTEGRFQTEDLNNDGNDHARGMAR